MPDSAYPAMVDTLRDFLDDLASASLDEATIVALAADLRDWRGRLAPLKASEDERMFGRVDDVPGHGQVMCPAFAIEEQDATSIRAQVTFGDYFLGGNAAAHGGAVSLLFDEVLGIPANSGPGGMARTAYLHVNYRAITPMNRPLTVTATLYAAEGRKRFVRGELKDGERLCADAEGLFLELLPGQQ
jgi:acyl-coenzyme A thioesterase PaaI-like protein